MDLSAVKARRYGFSIIADEYFEGRKGNVIGVPVPRVLLEKDFIRRERLDNKGAARYRKDKLIGFRFGDPRKIGRMYNAERMMAQNSSASVPPGL